MKKSRIIGQTTLFLVALTTLMLTLSSCEKKVNDVLRWRIANEQAFSKYADNTEYEEARIDGNSAFVYIKWLEKGEGKENPISTSRVDVHYEVAALTEPDMIIDGNYSVEAPMRISLHRGQASSIEGFCIALQNMVEGDECEIIIPWYLAYGEGGSVGTSTGGQIRGYTALKFKVKLDAIVPETVPA